MALQQLRLEIADTPVLPAPRQVAWRSASTLRRPLPMTLRKICVPPMKCQGIKTKLAPFIASSVRWSGQGRWIEPFLGSGVMLFNIAPARAYAADLNEHIIRFYRAIAAGELTPGIARTHLEHEGHLLADQGAAYYYEVRDRFNTHHAPLDFLFLNRACFNGVMRFNRRGAFNVPFGKKPQRFRPAYITKIVNQIGYVAALLREREWTFEVADWRETVRLAESNDFVYADPPYFGRSVDYYSSWTEADATDLVDTLRAQPAGFALSTWAQNRYRRNPQIDHLTPDLIVRTTQHFYHVGPTEDRRNAIEEALLIRTGFATDDNTQPSPSSMNHQAL